jgi:1-phosphatidylinositol-4-phosphate 5-kinase
MCDTPMRELSNPGASGSLFWLSGDDIFIVKTVQKGESRFLRRLLSGYYLNLTQNKRTLLPKFFGHFCYKSTTGKHIRFTVMQNILPSHLTYSERYDLKG